MKNALFPSITEFGLQRSLLDLIDAINEAELTYHTSSLTPYFHDRTEMETAINRAMRVCSNVGIPLERHFRMRYVSDSNLHVAGVDWRMSRTGFMLSIINGNPSHPLVSRLQIELLKNYL
ncbi:MAG: hypothetical protein Kow0075_16110 [Salibacteraceae bacterium]